MGPVRPNSQRSFLFAARKRRTSRHQRKYSCKQDWLFRAPILSRKYRLNDHHSEGISSIFWRLCDRRSRRHSVAPGGVAKHDLENAQARRDVDAVLKGRGV
jgi:hypothetical protein